MLCRPSIMGPVPQVPSYSAANELLILRIKNIATPTLTTSRHCRKAKGRLSKKVYIKGA